MCLQFRSWVLIYSHMITLEICTKILGLSIFNPTSHRFYKWNWKAKAQRGLSAILWWLKSALKRFKRSFSLRQKLCPIIVSFSGLCLAWNKESLPPLISSHPSKTRWSSPWLTCLVRAQRKRLNQHAPRGAAGDDWHSQDNPPLKHCWVFSPLQQAFCSLSLCCFFTLMPLPLPLLPSSLLHVSLPSLSFQPSSPPQHKSKTTAVPVLLHWDRQITAF